MPELKSCPACGSDNVECLVCTINADEEQDVHFHIACEACYTSGPIGDNGEMAADKWNSLPRRPDYNDVDCAGCPERRHSALTWGEEPPTVPGWYWMRSNSKIGHVANAEKENCGGVFEIMPVKIIDGRPCYDMKFEDSPITIDTEIFEWAGPIPTPHEPEES